MNLPSDPRLPIITDEKIKPLTQRLYELFRQIFTAINEVSNTPVFRYAKTSGNQAMTQNIWAKVTFTGLDIDTGSCFANSRFTPTIAGYYFIRAATAVTDASFQMCINKNATGVNAGFCYDEARGWLQTSDVVYLNGTTDYVEVAAMTTNVGQSIYASGTLTTFSGYLARPA